MVHARVADDWTAARLARTLGGRWTDELVLTASAGSVEALRSVEGWVGDHLVRFGKRDALEVGWVER